jgi:hypothetical protein
VAVLVQEAIEGLAREVSAIIKIMVSWILAGMAVLESRV